MKQRYLGVNLNRYNVLHKFIYFFKILFLQVIGIAVYCSGCIGIKPSPQPTSSIMPTAVQSHTLAATTTTPSNEIHSTLATGTATLTPFPSKTATSSPNPTITPTSTIEYHDVRRTLVPGIYFVFWRNNLWYVQGLEGSSATSLMPYESTNSLASLSPDGNKVAFVDSDNQISILDLDTGDLATYPNSFELTEVRTLEWSPDGTMLLYSGYKYVDIVIPTGIYVITLNDGETVCLIDNSISDRFSGTGGYDPDWSPGGEWIAFEHMSYGDFVLSLYIINTDCIDDPMQCREEARLIANQYLLGWSPQGQLTYSCVIGDQYGPCVANPDSFLDPRLITNVHPFTSYDETFYMANARWSPNGIYLAFAVTYQGEDYIIYGDIYRMKSDGSELINLTNTTDFESLNEWSPDGQFIAYTYYYGAAIHNNGDIFVIPAEGGEAINITNTPNENDVFAFWMVIK